MIAVALTLLLAAQPREHVGQCFTTTVTRVTTRFNGEDRPAWSGSVLDFADGHYAVTGVQERGMDTSRKGDPTRICVLAVEHGCKLDPPGSEYKGQNLRTGLHWSASSAYHQCD